MVFFIYTIFIALVFGKSPKIVGGNEVTDTTTFPWLVAIISRNLTDEADSSWYNKSNYFDRQFCGGSIIDASWIVTAAHCFEDVSEDEVAIVAATYNLSTTMGELRYVSQVIVHENYDDDTTVNDIALIQLAQPLVLSDSVAVILPINKDDPVVDGQIYTLAGWGANDMNGTEYSPILNTVDVPAVSLDDCSEVLDNIYNTNLCAGGVYGEDSCFGDSGGPMTMVVNSTELLYGIVSWGLDQCATDSPAVYTDVAMYRGWIEDNSGLTLGNEAEPSCDNNNNTVMIVGIIVGVIVVCVLILLIWKYACQSKDACQLKDDGDINPI